VETESVTRLLIEWSRGNDGALDKITPLVYAELRRLAANYMKRERRDHTLQPTALVNEAYIRMVDQQRVSWQNRAHFVGVAAKAMRHILIDHARKARAAKRGVAAQRVTFDENRDTPDGPDVDLIALDEALVRLTEMDPRQGRVVELRVFGGLSVEETAEVLKISTPTVKRDWSSARAWLYQQLRRS